MVSKNNPILSKIQTKQRRWTTNIIISDFKVKEVADVISFQREFLGRTELSDLQKELYIKVWGDKGGEWNTDYSEIVLLIGMKGGKNFWSEGDVAYACYFISCLRDPHEYFSKITKRPVKYTYEKTFDIVNVSSVDETQARRAFFESVKKVLRLAKDPASGENWFEKYAGLDLREAWGDFGRKEIVFPTRAQGVGGIRLLSFNSTATAPEGLHIIRFYADELSRADTKAKYQQAKALLELGLNNTAASFPNGVGKVLEWSYPNRTDYDLTYDRYLLSNTNEKILGVKAKTYEFNPSLTLEMLKSRYEKDLTEAKRVYECEKPVSITNFFTPYTHKLDECVREEIENKVKYYSKTIEREAKGKRYKFTTIEFESIEGDNRVRCFALDPSKVRDRFVIVGGYYDIIDELKIEMFYGDESEVITTNIRPVIDIAIVIEPHRDAPVDYIAIGDIFTKLIKHFPNTHKISADHFQSEKFRQEIIKQGIRSEIYHFSNAKQLELYRLLKANVWNNNVLIMKDKHRIEFSGKIMSITDALLHEAKSIMQEGGKIDHPEWGSKDILDSVVILNYDLMNIELLNNISGDINALSETQLKTYVKQYINVYSMLESAHTPKELFNKIIAQKLNLSEQNVINLAKYVEEFYT